MKRKTKKKIKDYRQYYSTKICLICNSLVSKDNIINHLEQKHNFEVPVNKTELNNLYKELN